MFWKLYLCYFSSTLCQILMVHSWHLQPPFLVFTAIIVPSRSLYLPSSWHVIFKAHFISDEIKMRLPHQGEQILLSFFLVHQDGSTPSNIPILLYFWLFFYILQVHISLLLPYCRHGHCGVFSGRRESYWVKLVIQDWSLSSSHTLEEARIEGVGDVTTHCKERGDVVVVSLWLNIAS